MNPETNALNRAYKELNTVSWQKELTQYETGKPLDLYRAFDTLPKSESRAAKAIQAKFAHFLTYNPDLDQWYFWDGRIHRPCVGDGLVKKLVDVYYGATVKAIVLIESEIKAQATAAADPEAFKRTFNSRLKDYKFFRDSISKASGHSSMAKVLKMHVDVAPDHYANDMRWFVVENGVYDMDDVRKTREFKLLPHDAARPVYREWNLVEEIGASHSALDKFTSESIEDEGQALFLQKIMGTALMGITSEVRSIVSVQGQPQSGKSMILRILKEFGPAFISTPPRDAIVKNARAFEHAKYKMRDSRIAGFTEITDKLNREFILQYSGMDEVTSEEKYVANAGWKPQGIIFMFSNHGMNIDKNDQAIYDRIKPVNFPYTFQRDSLTGHELDITLEDQIVEQRAGFLEWIKAGFLMGLEEGYEATDSMKALKNEERDSEDDDLRTYFADRFESNILYNADDAKDWVKPTDLHKDYLMWHSTFGTQVKLGRNTFASKVSKLYEKGGHDNRYFVGLGLYTYIPR